MRNIVCIAVMLSITFYTEAQTNVQNTGESNPVIGAQWEKKSNGWISEWVFNYVRQDGWYELTSPAGKVVTIYVEVINTSSEQQAFLGRYFDGEYAAHNRNWLRFAIGSRIWFTEKEYYSYAVHENYRETTATHAECGNGMVIQTQGNVPQAKGYDKGIQNPSTRKFAIHNRDTRNVVTERSATSQYQTQHVEERVVVDHCTDLQRKWAMVQARYDQKQINRSTAKVQFQYLVSMDTEGCLLAMKPHYRNTGAKIAAGVGILTAGVGVGYLLGSNRTHTHNVVIPNNTIPHTEPGYPLNYFSGRNVPAGTINGSSGRQQFLSAIGGR